MNASRNDADVNNETVESVVEEIVESAINEIQEDEIASAANDVAGTAATAQSAAVEAPGKKNKKGKDCNPKEAAAQADVAQTAQASSNGNLINPILQNPATGQSTGGKNVTTGDGTANTPLGGFMFVGQPPPFAFPMPPHFGMQMPPWGFGGPFMPPSQMQMAFPHQHMLPPAQSKLKSDNASDQAPMPATMAPAPAAGLTAQIQNRNMTNQLVPGSNVLYCPHHPTHKYLIRDTAKKQWIPSTSPPPGFESKLPPFNTTVPSWTTNNSHHFRLVKRAKISPPQAQDNDDEK